MSSASLNRLPGLDGIRSIAVLLVLFFHQHILGFGWIGVQIFFVLSGFLITRILVQSRELGLKEYLVEFYGRRSLRIFPLYYGVLLLLGLLTAVGFKAQGVREGLPYAATYTYNFWHASDGFVHSQLISHFWSLCVEEQFYLVWPFFIFFCPQRALRPALLTIVALGPLVRAALYQLLTVPAIHAYAPTDVALYVLMPSHADAFALGAYFSLYPLGGSRKAFLGSFAFLALGCALTAPLVPDDPLYNSSLGLPLGLPTAAGYIWGYSLLNLCAALLIDCVVHRRVWAGLFESRPLNYLGKISYGVYVFHYPFQSILQKALPNVPLFVQIVVQLALTIAVASASFHLWEMPFLRKKDVWFKPGQGKRRAASGVPEELLAQPTQIEK